MTRIKHTRITVRRWFTLFGIATAALLTFFSVFIALYASHILRQNTYSAAIQSLRSYRDQLQLALRGEELYLAGFTYDSSLIDALDQADPSGTSWFRASYALQNEFTSHVGLSSWENYFYYSPDIKLMIANRSFTGNGYAKSVLPRFIDNLYSDKSDQTSPRENPAKKWNILKIDNDWYLLYVRRQRNGYLGSSIRLAGFLSTINNASGKIHNDFSDSKGVLLGNGADTKLDELPDEIARKGYTFENFYETRNLVCVLPIMNTSVSIVSLTPDHSLDASVRIFQSLVLLIFLIGLMVFVVFYLASKRMVATPVQRILSAMKSIRSGHRETRIHLDAGCQEFVSIGQSFNETIDEIDRLSSAVLSEQLAKKQAQIEYLKLQVTPHFLINCLNSVYQLTEIGENELSLKMTESLTTFLRYLINCGRSVSLTEELHQAENYANFSLIRYPGGLTFHSEVTPDAKNATVVPYLILGFVENTVKYSVSLGSMTHIEVRIMRTENDQLLIRMSDTGSGYSKEALARLNRLNDASFESHSDHIGLENVCHRVRLVLGDHCHFQFENDPVTGGAVNTILIPWQPWEGDKYEPVNR